jgi:hypothetical protein
MERRMRRRNRRRRKELNILERNRRDVRWSHKHEK